ncbi:hypothetical protein SHPE106448_21390 [Shewanella pealeana]
MYTPLALGALLFLAQNIDFRFWSLPFIAHLLIKKIFYINGQPTNPAVNSAVMLFKTAYRANAIHLIRIF